MIDIDGATRRAGVRGAALTAAVVITVASGCASGGGSASVDGATPPGSDRIVLERLDGTRWRATYHLTEPTASLQFQRPATFYRERAWDVITTGYELGREGDLQVLRLTEDGVARDEIVVEFDRFTDQLTAEYEFFVSFSDGAQAVYTGHLYARPDSRPMIRTLRLAPVTGESLVLRDGVHSAAIDWTDEYEDGTYVYFGRAEPLETDEVIVVFDEGLPPWLREQFDEWLSRLFALYRDRLDAALPWKPLVLYGHQASDRSGYSYGGGALTGLIQLSVSGDSWAEPTPIAGELALGFLAHEVAHLWNGQLTTNRGTDRWIHEGSADAFADRVLHEFGIIDDESLRRRRQDALNECFLRLDGEPVKEAGDAQASYKCGQVMALWTEASIRAAGSEADLFGFWAELVQESLRHDGVYDAERYLEVAGSFGVPDSVQTRMRVALHTDEDPVSTIVEGLRAAGLEIDERGIPSPYYRSELARRVMGHVMGGACQGQFSFSGTVSFETYAIEGCEPFDTPHRVDLINGLEVRRRGEQIYDSVAETCAEGGSVTLSPAESGDELDVVCEEALRPRPPWYSIGVPTPNP